MFKQKCNRSIVDARDIRTRAHDAILFNTRIPVCEKYKHINLVYFLLYDNEFDISANPRIFCFKKIQILL